MPTDAQLAAAARAVSYRCQQLAGTARLIGRPNALLKFDIDEDGWSPALTVTNAVVESALINARAIAFFVVAGRKGEARAVDFERVRRNSAPGVPSQEIVELARTRILGPVSAHLAHVMHDRKLQNDQEPTHPGAWPIPELALVLVGAVADLVGSLEPAWALKFRPDPRFYAAMLAPLQHQRTIPSRHRSVRRLAQSLHSYLDHVPNADAQLSL